MQELGISKFVFMNVIFSDNRDLVFNSFFLECNIMYMCMLKLKNPRYGNIRPKNRQQQGKHTNTPSNSRL